MNSTSQGRSRSSLLSSAFLLTQHGRERPDQHDAADHGDAAGQTPPDQTSIPNASAPPATTTQTTGQKPAAIRRFKKMNEKDEGQGRAQGIGATIARRECAIPLAENGCGWHVRERDARRHFVVPAPHPRARCRATLHEPALCFARSAYFLSANTQTTPPCGTLFSTPTLLLGQRILDALRVDAPAGLDRRCIACRRPHRTSACP